jgi:TPR repeat protein
LKTKWLIGLLLLSLYGSKYIATTHDVFQSYYSKALDGNVKAQYKIAKFYQQGRFISKDKKKAFYWMEKSAESGYKWAQFDLANMYKRGEGIQQNLPMAVSYMILSAKQDHMWAAYNLGIMYFEGLGVQKDYQRAFYWLQTPAVLGYSKAIQALAKMYYYGYGVPKDRYYAMEILKEALELQDGYALEFLADISLEMLYPIENAQQGDKEEIIDLYQRAVKQGNKSAKFTLATLYYQGKVIEKDLMMAIQLYEELVKDGYSKAIDPLVSIYLNESGNPQKASTVYIKKEFLKASFYMPKVDHPILWSELLY